MPDPQEWLEAPAATPHPFSSDEEKGRGLVPAIKQLLKAETERLRLRQATGLGGSEIAAARSDVVDTVVSWACREAAAADPGARRELSLCAIVALGGYGRRELCPYSDVDLLFLHAGSSSSPAVAAFVQRTLVTLWDSGLAIGHSFRSPRESVAAATDDLHSRTALCEARLVIGNAELFDTLRLRLDTSLLRNGAAQERFLGQMRAEWRERQEKFGHSVCVLEPQVKEGPGGLRDLHTLLWVSHAQHGTGGLAGLEAAGLLEPADLEAVRVARDFLLRVRNEAHFTTGRHTDLLTLDLHGELAPRLGYHDRGSLLASERLMRDYYRRASRLHEVCRTFVETHLEPRARRRFLPRLGPRRTGGWGAFAVKDGLLHAREGATLGPGQLLEAFEVAQAEGVPFSRALKRTVREGAPLFGKAFRATAEAGAALQRLAAAKGRVGPAVRALHETGVLGRLVPQWARITFLVQHDFFHKYTVDEHTLRAVEALDELAAGQDPAQMRLAALLDQVRDVRPLYLGMLLHDIAKGRGGGHVPKGVVLARRILDHPGIEREVAETAVFLVGAHLEMSQTAQQRDLSEPGLIESFAARVGSVEKLSLLMLLTYADHRAVGPGIWTEWKASLLWELYGRARHWLEAQRDGGPLPAQHWRHAAAELQRTFPAAEVEAHFAALPERYLRATDAQRQAAHFRLLRALGDHPALFDWADRGDGRGTELTVVAPDRPGLFSLLAGTLTVHGIDILGADLFANSTGTVIDTLRVAELPGQRPLRPERRQRLEAVLLDAVAGRLDVPAAFARWEAQHPRKGRRPGGRAARAPRVRFDQEASSLATVVEVRAPDQPGLAYTLAHTLAGQGLDIGSARIATEKALVVDVFYVRDAEGRKLDDAAMGRVEAALLAALGEGS